MSTDNLLYLVKEALRRRDGKAMRPTSFQAAIVRRADAAFVAEVRELLERTGQA